MEDNNVNFRSENIEFSTNNIESNNKTNKINISSVVDINEVNRDEYARISNTLLALMNSRDSKMNNSTINIKWYEKDENLKVMLWGDMEFTKSMLDFISTITDTKSL